MRKIGSGTLILVCAIAIFACVFVLVPGQAQTAPAKAAAQVTLYRNGRIYTNDPAAPWAAAMLVRGEEILAVGDDDVSLAKAAGDIGTTIFHPVGTAKMGAASDSLAVVDQRLRFYGMAGLRVADASVMPTITSGNTNTPTAMIAEKGAAMILEDLR